MENDESNYPDHTSQNSTSAQMALYTRVLQQKKPHNSNVWSVHKNPRKKDQRPRFVLKSSCDRSRMVLYKAQ